MVNNNPPNLPTDSSPTAIAAEAALPMEVVLVTLADGLQDRKAKQAVKILTQQINRGESLEVALAEVDRTAPRYLGGLLRAAINSGNVAAVCDGFLQQRESRGQTTRELRNVLIYPLFLGFTLTALAFLFSLWIVPTFDSMYNEFELELPYMTQATVLISPWVPWGMLLFLVSLVALLVIPEKVGIPFLHRFRTTLPVIGRLYIHSGQQQFSAMLANFVLLRVPMAAALNYTGDLMADRNVGAASYRLASAVEQGQALSEVMARSKHFDPTLPALIHWGETGSHLGETLQIATEMFGDRLRHRASFILRIFPSTAIIFVAIGTILLAVSLFLPSIGLIEGLS